MLHYMLDAYNTLEDQTNNLLSINEFLIKLANNLDLKTIMPPYLVPYYYSKELDDGGVSAFVLLEGGHITIHTFPYRACYFLDIAASDFFNSSKGESVIISMFKASNFKSYLTDRRLEEELYKEKPEPHVDFGPHYMITVKDVDMTLDSIYKWLDSIAPKINMEAIIRPYVAYSTVKNAKYISGMLIVAQSHIAVHYNIEEKLAYIDIFSCSFLKNEQIEMVLKESFGDNLKYQLMVRGSKYAHEYQNTEERLDAYGKWQKNKEK